MQQRDVRAFLWDVERACEMLVQAGAERSLDDYVTDIFLRYAVERAFEVIGEALRNISAIDPAIAARVTDVPEIVAFRNKIAHEYWRVLAVIVWGTILNDIPVLRGEVQALLRELPPPADDGSVPA